MGNKNSGKKVEDLTGQIFGKLTVVSMVKRKKKEKVKWYCKCLCGNNKDVIVSSHNLKSGSVKSCGCLKKEYLISTRIDIIGEKYGNLTVLERVEDINEDTAWLCECICGNKEIFRTEDLRSPKFNGKCSMCPKNLYEFIDNYVIGTDINNNKYYIDIIDFEKIKTHSWCIAEDDYVIAKINKCNLKLNRFILDVYDENIIVDHIDGNPKNNRRYNLRICTKQENCFNRKVQIRNTSGVTGVCWSKVQNKWQAKIGVNYKYIHLGYYEKFEDAVLARLEGEYKYFGEYRSKRNDDYIQSIINNKSKKQTKKEKYILDGVNRS